MARAAYLFSLKLVSLGLLAACGSQTSGTDLSVILPSADLAHASDLALDTDLDEDGLPDAQELAWAAAYLPYISTSPSEGCPVAGMLVRVRPHPDDPTLVLILYDFLYNADCGISGHDGDDEAFGMTIDPTRPAPGGIISMKAISHQGTICERDSSCGQCAGLSACQTTNQGGVAWPTMWPSKNKHGSYVDATTTCAFGATCLDECDDNPTPTVPMIVNAGEPGHPLVSDLTTQGFITSANGWTHMELFHFDPWKPGIFGGAGDISQDLVDPSFVTVACHPSGADAGD